MKSTELTEASSPLPPYLARTEVMELDDLPLQVSLLTMELANQRLMLQRMAVILETAARMMHPPGLDLQD